MSEGSFDNPDAEPFEAQIAAFFADYTDAFAREDADALAEMWDEVGLFPTPAGNFAMERAAFRDHCAGLMAFYRRQGVHKPEGRLVCAVELFPGVVQARMAYRMLGEAGAVVAEWDHVYILRRHDRWRVSLTIADGEMAAWQALGAEF
jgi:hypothetical protein